MNQRRLLKHQLMTEKAKLNKGIVCREPIEGGCDMHEVLITRGDVQKANEVRSMIFVRENCVLVHHGPCHQRAQYQTEGKERCVLQLLDEEGQRICLSGWISWMACCKQPR